MCRCIAWPGTFLGCFLLAACVHTGSKTPAASVQYSLAVFPWNIVEGYSSGGSPFDITMSAFRRVLARSAFVPVFSYYKLHESTTTTKELPIIGSIWGGRDVMSNPNHEVAFQLGEQLGVEAVITYAVDERQSKDDLWVYLFDIPSKRTYSAYESTGHFTREAPAILTVMTRKVFGQFLRHRA